MEPTATAVEAAAVEIAKILKRLEAETGTIVNRIQMRELDITAHGDSRGQRLCSVEIEMLRIPGHGWGVDVE